MEINNRPRRQQPKFIIENNNNKVVLPTQAYASPKHTQHKTVNVKEKEKIEEVTQPLNPPLPLPSSVNEGKSRRTQSRPVTISSSASISAHNVRATVKPPSLPSKRRKTVVNNVEDGTRGTSSCNNNPRLTDEQHETPKARRVVLPSSSTSTRVKFEDNNKHTTSTSNKSVKYENPTYVNIHNTSISDLIDPSIASISRRNDARIIRSCNGGGVGSGVVTLPSSKKTVLNVNNNVKGEFMTFKKDRNKKDIIPDDENDKIPPIKSLTFKRSRYDAEETHKIMTSIKKAVSISAGIHTSKKKDVKFESDLKKKKIVPYDEEESKRSFNVSSDIEKRDSKNTEQVSSSGSGSIKNCCKIKLKEQPIIINSKDNTVTAQRFDELLEIYQNNQKYYIFNGFDERAIKKLEEWFTSIIEPCSSPKGSEDYKKWKFREKGKNKAGYSYYCDDKLIYLFR